MSRALCQNNARIYERALVALAGGVGRGFLPVLERAVDEAGDV